MIHSPEIESSALQLLRDCWEQACRRHRKNGLSNPMLDDMNDRIAKDMLPRLLHLLHDKRDSDVQVLIHSVKRVIIEHMVYENATSQMEWEHSIEAQTKLVTAVVQAAREKLSAEGEWSDEPVPPMMFG
ncbi:MAG: hypothetical protein ACF8OB_13670 [Phycisphaeraceae bacterium JB051]